MKMKRIVITGICLTFAFTITQAQVTLQFAPEAGANYEYRTEIVQNIKQRVGDRTLPIEETVTMDFLMNVKSRNAKGAETYFTFRDISYLLSSPMLQMEYDSKKLKSNASPLDKMQEKIFGSVVGKSFTLVISPDGTVKNVNGVDAITKEIKRAVAADGPMGDQMSASEIQQWLGKDALKGMFEQSFRIYPAKEVKVGDHWTVKSKYGISNKKSTITTVYTLTSIQNDLANISVDATVIFEPAGGVEGTLSGSQAGEIIVNTKTGIPVSSDLTLNINGNVKQNNMNMVMEMIAKMKTIINE